MPDEDSRIQGEAPPEIEPKFGQACFTDDDIDDKLSDDAARFVPPYEASGATLPETHRRVEFVEHDHPEVPGTVRGEECVLFSDGHLTVGRSVAGIVASIRRHLAEDLGDRPTPEEVFDACAAWGNGYLYGREI